MQIITAEQRCAWLKAISQADLVGDKVVVCERHFKKGVY